MIDFIKGTFIQIKDDRIVIETASSVGYVIYITSLDMSKLPPLGASVVVYTHPIIKEDSHKLYGFLNPLERDFFELLIQISGIGPRLGLSILSHITLPELFGAVQLQREEPLTHIPGVGKKMREKLLLELKTTFAKFKQDPALLSSSPVDPETSDAIKALIHLGYSPTQARQAVFAAAKEKPKASLAELLTVALKQKGS